MAATPSPSPEAEIAIGSVLDGRYRIDAILGSGGMGRVYKGEHTGIGRPVAIKVLHADLNRNREAAQRFQREAMASGRLDHPNIVNVSDFGVVDHGPCYLVMEVLEGESLGARLERDKRIAWREAIEILRGVLHGLKHAHERGVVHRDIKPDNVFLTRKDGELVVKILDFGIAKLYAGDPDDPVATRAGLTVGTPAYLSPEQAVGGLITPASDLYSATIVLFEMITGRAPFEDKDPLAMLGAHVSREPPRIADVAPDVPVPALLEDVIQHGLIKTSATRIGSADDYIAHLDAVIASARLGSAPIVPQHAPEAMGSAPTASFHTPPPGAPSPGGAGSPHTPLPGAISHHTPPPGTLSPLTPSPEPAGHDNTMILLTDRKSEPAIAPPPTTASPTRMISLDAAPPLPRNWLRVAALVIAGCGLIAIIALAMSRKSPPPPADPLADKPATEPKPKAKTVEPKAKEPEKTTEEERFPKLPSLVDPAEKDQRLKALLHDLEKGKTCTDRKAAIPGLVDLGDERAIKPLRAARYRMRGGLLGFNSSNTNSCLKADAEAAIKSLGGTLK
ncbi:MAG: serine/threonine protein kinase [Myxococcales bacterium]|nr:serine/threonine protein kinase [Myxococcales bacterium]